LILMSKQFFIIERFVFLPVLPFKKYDNPVLHPPAAQNILRIWSSGILKAMEVAVPFPEESGPVVFRGYRCVPVTPCYTPEGAREV